METELLLLIPIGSASLVAAIFLIRRQLFLMFFANQITGKVVALEKYVSETRSSNNHRTKTTFYRPIVEFEFQDKTYKTTGASVSNIRHKIGDPAQLVVETDKAGEFQSVSMPDSVYIIIALILMILAGALLGVAVTKFSAPIWGVGIAIVVVFGLAQFLGQFVKDKNQSGLFEKRKDSEIIDTVEKLDAITKSHRFVGLIVAGVFLAIALGVTALGYSNMSTKTRKLITDFPALKQKVKAGSLSETQKKNLILFGAGAFFTFFSSLSVIQTALKK